MTSNQRELSVQLLKRIQRRTRLSADGDQEAAAAFVARFIQRVLTRLSGQSRTATRAPSPAILDNENDTGNPDNENDPANPQLFYGLVS
jgi:hypothetical protein